VSPPVGKGRGEEAARSTRFRYFSRSGVWAHTLPAMAARGEDAPPLSCNSGSLPNTVPVVQKVFPVNSRLFWVYYCYFNVIFFSCFEFVFCIVDVKKKEKKEKEKKEKEKKKKYSKSVCVFVFVLWMFFF
jgi:hypothetical protein